MKIQKYTKTSISILLTLLLSYWLVSAWTNLSSVTTWDTLTATVWNDMATKLNDAWQRASGIFTDGSSNVGVGINTPWTRLHVYNNAWHSEVRVQTSVTWPTYVPAFSLKNPSIEWSLALLDWYWLNFRENSSWYASRMFFENWWNVWIWTTSPRSKLSLGFNNDDQINLYSQWDNELNIQTSLDWQAIWSYGWNAATLHIQPTAGMVSMVTWWWNLWVWIASATQKLHVNGTALATAWNTTSDIRKKENIYPIKNSLEKISNLRWVNFTWKESKKQDSWVIAQDVEKIFPEFVTTDSEWYKSVDYGKLTAPLIEAVKELKKENEKKDKQIEDLIKRVEKLENK